jgi:hypothetical protein
MQLERGHRRHDERSADRFRHPERRGDEFRTSECRVDRWGEFVRKFVPSE